MTLELDLQLTPPPSDDYAELATRFCTTAPYKLGEYGRRNWGAPLHSLCSYQGKLKPSIAHYLVSWFTRPGDTVLDPLAGVGTIPLEARRQGRVGLASDLSPLADAVCRAKLQAFGADEIDQVVDDLQAHLAHHEPDDRDLDDLRFGLNGPLSAYFHETTAREILIARHFFRTGPTSTAHDVVRTAILHILHGNRPYALSRNSHPVTPFAPTGPTLYKSVIAGVTTRLKKIIPELLALDTELDHRAIRADFRDMPFTAVDAVITSPPFSKSLRFWSSNWMRLWFAGWSPDDFASEPGRYLEKEQARNLAVYARFAEAMHTALKPGGRLIMHLGQTLTVNMAEEIAPLLDPHFRIVHVGRECVLDTESHGLTDKGATVAHWYLFATAR